MTYSLSTNHVALPTHSHCLDQRTTSLDPPPTYQSRCSIPAIAIFQSHPSSAPPTHHASTNHITPHALRRSSRRAAPIWLYAPIHFQHPTAAQTGCTNFKMWQALQHCFTCFRRVRVMVKFPLLRVDYDSSASQSDLMAAQLQPGQFNARLRLVHSISLASISRS